MKNNRCRSEGRNRLKRWGTAACCALLAAGLLLLPGCGLVMETALDRVNENLQEYVNEMEALEALEDYEWMEDEPAGGDYDIDDSVWADYDTLEALLDLFNEDFSPSDGYEYLGMAYFLDDEEAPRGVYIPYGDDTKFEQRQVFSKNHGISFTVYITRQYKDAADALSNMTFSIQLGEALENLEYHDIGGSTADNDTVGLRMFAATGNREDETEVVVFQVNYADIRDDGYYLIALMTFDPQEYDEETPALIEEINDCYAITMPTDPEWIWQMVNQSRDSE